MTDLTSAMALGLPHASSGPLSHVHDAALVDLDGVVYVGSHAIASAARTLRAATDAGLSVRFVTNNASRTPQTIAAHLLSLGIEAVPTQVVTSAQAAAHYLFDLLPARSRVLVLGSPALATAVAECGLRPVYSAEDGPHAVVQGFASDISWAALAEAAIAIARDVAWVATNADATLPSARGPVPGNGSLVAALTKATGRTPTVVGKPQPAMHRAAMRSCVSRRPIVVGDRLDTDIAGAVAAECASLLVLSGVTDSARLLAAGPYERPTYIARDIAGLLDPHPAVVTDTGWTRCGAWTVSIDADALRLARVGGPGPSDDDELDALRALCAARWGNDQAPTRIEGVDTAARMALARLG